MPQGKGTYGKKVGRPRKKAAPGSKTAKGSSYERRRLKTTNSNINPKTGLSYRRPGGAAGNKPTKRK